MLDVDEDDDAQTDADTAAALDDWVEWDHVVVEMRLNETSWAVGWLVG